MLTISFIGSKDIESEAFFFKQLLEHMSSDVCIHEFKLPATKNETRGFEKWPAEMLSEILENPFIFSGQMYNIDDVAIEYITLAEELDTDINFCRSHLFKFFYQACKMNFEFNERLGVSHSYKDLLDLAYEIKEYRKEIKNEDKFGWYYRYRKEDNPYKESLSFKKEPIADELKACEKSDTNDLSNMFN